MSLTKATYSMISGAWVNVYDFMTEAQITAVQSGVSATPVTSAVQAAIDYAIAKKYKTIYFPKGQYLVSYLSWGGDPKAWDLEFVGDGLGIDGRGTEIRSTTAGAIFRIDLRGVQGGTRGFRCSNMSITSDGTSDGVKCYRTEHMTFDNVAFDRLRYGVIPCDDSHFPLFVECRFTDNLQGVVIPSASSPDFGGGANGGTLINCLFNDNTEYAGIFTDAEEWVFLNCDFEIGNGPLVLGDSSRVMGCRFELNDTTKNWLVLAGNRNKVDLDVHDAGAASFEYRVKVEGSLNDVHVYSPWTFLLVDDVGGNNRYKIDTLSDWSFAYPPMVMNIQKNSSCILNNTEICIQHRAPGELSNNHVDPDGAIVSGTSVGTIATNDVTGLPVTGYSNAVTAQQQFALTNETIASDSLVYCSVDFFSNAGLQSAVVFDGVTVQTTSGIAGAWYRKVMLLNNKSPLVHSGSVVQVIRNAGWVGGDFGVGQVQYSVNKAPTDYYSVVTTNTAPQIVSVYGRQKIYKTTSVVGAIAGALWCNVKIYGTANLYMEGTLYRNNTAADFSITSKVEVNGTWNASPPANSSGSLGITTGSSVTLIVVEVFA